MTRTLGSVCGGLGLLLVLFTAPIAYFTVNSLVPFIAALALGIGCLVVWGLNGAGQTSTWLRSAFFYSSSVGLTAVFLLVLIAVNFIAARRAPSWDLTKQKVYSLSPQTQTMLAELKSPVKVLAFTKDDPPEAAEELFRKYAALSEQFSWEFVDPRKNPDLTRRYAIREGQQAAVILGGTAEKPMHGLINLGRLANPLLAEQELTNGILKLETVGTQKLYFVVGHNEVPLEPVAQTEEGIAMSLAGLKRVLEDEGYAPTALNLVQASAVPADASALIIAGARNKFSDHERQLLTDYVNEGGRLMIFGEYGSNMGLEALLAAWGLQLEDGLVADAKVNPEQPYLVYTPFLGEHEIVTPLVKAQSNLLFPTTRAVTKLAVEGVTVTPLVLTTPYAWIESTIGEKPSQSDGERAGQLILAAVATHATDPSLPSRRLPEGRLVLFGDSDVLAGAISEAANRDLVLNTIAWTTQQLKKITIRPPDRDLSSVDLDNDKLSTIRGISMALLPTLLLAVGLTIWNLRRAR